MTPLDRLADQIRDRCPRRASAGVEELARQLSMTYRGAARAVLFYGSCLRTGDEEGLVDLYVLVDNYRSAFGPGVKALLNALLPPNVFYLEDSVDGRTVRAKYAVLSMEDFRRGTSRRWFHSYLWGRFCQPIGILEARDDATVREVTECLAAAVSTFAQRVVPRLRERFTASDLWRAGLALSYRAELRPERPERAAQLYEAARDHYEAITPIALGCLLFGIQQEGQGHAPHYRLHLPPWVRLGNRIAWRVRFLQGKMLSVLRLLKATTTFRGGLDYILWKIERHSGIRVEITPGLKRRPYLAVWVLAWRLYRKGAFH